MDFITADQAAERLGVTRTTVMALVSQGKIRRKQQVGSADVYASDVLAEEQRRRRAALVRHPDLARLAEHTLSIIRPAVVAGGRSGGPDAVKLLHPDVRAIFGAHALRTAAMRENTRGCRTCWVRMATDVYGFGPVPQPTREWLILLGDPCYRDAAFWAAQQDAADAQARRWVADSRTRDRKLKAMQARLRAREGERLIKEGKRLLGRSVTASATWTPANETESAMLVTARRARIDEQIQAAERRGDRAHAAQLKRMRRSL